MLRPLRHHPLTAVSDEPRSRRPERVAHRKRPSPRVEPRRIDGAHGFITTKPLLTPIWVGEHLFDREDLSGKGLVEFDDPHVAEGEPGAIEGEFRREDD